MSDKQEVQRQQLDTNQVGCAKFTAGGLFSCLEHWLELTSDKFVHDIIKGYKPFNFFSPVVQTCIPLNIVPGYEMVHMDHEIKELLDLNVIETCNPCSDQFLSNIFWLLNQMVHLGKYST